VAAPEIFFWGQAPFSSLLFPFTSLPLLPSLQKQDPLNPARGSGEHCKVGSGGEEIDLGAF